MRGWSGIVATALVAVSIPAHAVSIPATTLDQRGGGAGGPLPDSTQGWEFTVTTTVEVAALGLFDVRGPDSNPFSDGDGLLEEHQVGLWESDGTLLASVTVTPGSIARELFVYRLLAAPLTLEPGVTYVIAAHYPTSDEFVLADGANGDTFLYDERIIPGGGRLRFPEVGFSFPDTVTNFPSMGPGFLLVVPEPETIGLLGLALVGMRRRSRAR